MSPGIRGVNIVVTPFTLKIPAFAAHLPAINDGTRPKNTPKELGVSNKI